MLPMLINYKVIRRTLTYWKIIIPRLFLYINIQFKYLNRFTTASARGFFYYDLNYRTRNNGAKLIVKHFITSVAQHFYPIKITLTWNALPNGVVSSRTVNSFKNILDKHWTENPPNVRVNR